MRMGKLQEKRYLTIAGLNGLDTAAKILKMVVTCRYREYEDAVAAGPWC